MNYYETIASQACNNMSNFDLINKLKLDIEGEIATIELYEQHIDSIKDDGIRAILTEITNDEKDHLAKLTTLLNALGNG